MAETRPGLLDVYGTDDTLRRGGTLHRLDEDARCGSAPDYAGTSTDLITAAVIDGNSLCDHCDWPDGAAEVLADND